MKQKYLVFGVVSLATFASVTSSAFSHGWTEYPMARQSKCYNDGGFWSNAIPNEACKAAFELSGNYPFVQRNEVAALIPAPKYNDLDAVKAAIPDGTICSAGSDKKAGLDLPSPDWHKTKIQLDANGEFTFKFRGTAPHRPHFWQFFLTKADYDHSKAINWDDLELVFESGNHDITKVDGKAHFVFNVKLPTDRVGDAVLLTRWQREDPAGEGFYNCSDITLVAPGGVPEPQEPEVSSLVNSEPVVAENAFDDFKFINHFIEPGSEAVKIGESIRLRAFGKDAEEIVDVQMKIDPANLQTWLFLITEKFNKAIADAGQADNWIIGEYNPVKGVYALNKHDINANKVYSTIEGASFELSHILENEPVPEQVVEQRGAWDRKSVYEYSSIVTHNGKTWKAKWWNNGEEPRDLGDSGPWKLIAENAADTDPIDPEGNNPAEPATPETIPGNEDMTWGPNKIYKANDLAEHDGQTWKAKWWTQGEEPGTTGKSGVWELVGDLATAGAPAWSIKNIYNADDKVSHNGQTWKAKWWTQGEAPGTTAVWERVAEVTADGQSGWIADNAYNADDTVSHNGQTWKAKWWTRGEEPGTTAVWALVVEPTADGQSVWTADNAYNAGDTASHNGETWKAKWWTRGEVPGTTSAWERVVVEAAPGDQSVWTADNVYNAGDTASHNGETWKAKWWTRGEVPGTTSAWERVAELTADGQPGWIADNAYNAGDTVSHNGETWTAKWWTKGEEPGSAGEWGAWRK